VAAQMMQIGSEVSSAWQRSNGWWLKREWGAKTAKLFRQRIAQMTQKFVS